MGIAPGDVEDVGIDAAALVADGISTGLDAEGTAGAESKGEESKADQAENGRDLDLVPSFSMSDGEAEGGGASPTSAADQARAVHKHSCAISCAIINRFSHCCWRKVFVCSAIAPIVRCFCAMFVCG